MDVTGAFDIRGPQDATPIVLLHGIRLGRRSWEPHVELLSQRYRTIAFDLPRHGALAGVPFTLATALGLLHDACTRIARKPPIVAGYSLGGFLAMLYGAVRPEHTTGMALFGATVDLTGWVNAAFNAAVDAEMLVGRRLAESMAHAFMRLTLRPGVARPIIETPFDVRAYDEVRRVFAGIAFTRLLERYAKPVLIVNGTFDVPFSRRTQTFARVCNGAMLTIPGAMHTFPLNDPERFSSILSDFSKTSAALAGSACT